MGPTSLTRAALSALILSAAAGSLSAQKPPFPVDVEQIGVSVDGLYIPGIEGGDRMGRPAVGAGDVNGDGVTDMLIGIPQADQVISSNIGQVILVFGGPMGLGSGPGRLDLMTVPSVTFQGQVREGLLGQSVAGVGDTDGDGYDDFVIGVPSTNSTTARSGEAYLVYGRPDWPEEPITLSGVATGEWVRMVGIALRDRLGERVAGIGDFNHDGLSDFAVASPRADPNVRANAGEVYIIYGREGGHPPEIDLDFLLGEDGIRIIGDQEEEHLGLAMAGGTDLNGDGIADLVLGAPGADTSTPDAGRAYVIHGGDSSLGMGLPLDLQTAVDGDTVFRINATLQGGEAGSSVGMLGDIDGDGIGDLVIGAASAGPNNIIEAGQAHVILGRDGGISNGANDFSISSLNGINGSRLTGSDAGDHTGEHVAGLGDIDGDGLNDLFVGTPMTETPIPGAFGEVQIFYGAETPFLGQSDFFVGLINAGLGLRFVGATERSRLGASGDALGDIDGDGFPDYALGAFLEEIDFISDTGQVYVMRGFATSAVANASTTAPTGATHRRWINVPGGAADPWGPVRAAVQFDEGTGTSISAMLRREIPSGAGLPVDVAPATWSFATTRTGWATAEVSIHWTALEMLGLDERTIQIHHAPAISGPWTALQTTVDADRNEAAAEVTSLGFFALAASSPLSSQAILDDLLGRNPLPAGLKDAADLNRTGAVDVGDLIGFVNLGL